MNLGVKINTSPTQSDISIIKNWLIDEKEKYEEGFYCNWGIINNAFNEKRLIALNIDDIPIGFVIWRKHEIYADIDILEIKPNQRNNGFGEILFEGVSNFLKQQGVVVVKLFCQPRKSELFWKKMGFEKMPETRFSQPDLSYYKTLIEVEKKSSSPESNNKVELWNVDPYLVDRNSPEWTWNIEIKDTKLELPIIQPIDVDWNLRWTKNGEIIKEDKVKYFCSSKNKIDYSSFLYIKELSE